MSLWVPAPWFIISPTFHDILADTFERFTRRWVEEFRQEFAEFPNGEFDDLADAGVWGLMRIRQGNLIRLASDETEEEWKPRAPREYY